MTKDFILTDLHKKNGELSLQDFADYAGFDVPTFVQSDFPHWDTYLAQKKLEEHEYGERAEAIYQALIKCGGRDPRMGLPGHDHVNMLARCLGPIVSCEDHFFSIKEYAPSDHFGTIAKMGTGKGINPTSQFLSSHRLWGIPKSDYPIIVPGVLSEAVPINGASIHKAAVAIRDSKGAANYWSQMAWIPLDRLAYVPDDGMHNLETDLHELRHLRQITLHSASSQIPRFYIEADADLFKRHTLKKNNVGELSRTAGRHGRYISLLTIGPDYWFAPTLDAIEAKRYPPDFYSIFRSVMEIRTRLIMEGLGEPHKHINSKDFQLVIGVLARHPGFTSVRLDWSSQASSIGTQNQSPNLEAFAQKVNEYDDLYTHWWLDNLYHRPEVGYSILQQLKNDKVFTNSLSRTIVENILAAVKSFNPALTCEDNPQQKVSAPTRSIVSLKKDGAASNDFLNS